MRVVITGGSGFIGTNLMLWFGENEPDTEVIIFDTAVPVAGMPPNCRYVYGDIRNLHSCISAFTGADEVYNLAGILGTSELIPISSLASEVNIVGANNVMDAAVHCGVKRVYNVAKPFFDWYGENAYTMTKHAGELIGLMYREQFGIEVATIRWLNAVGPYQHLYPVRKFVPTMILFAMYDIDFEIYGDGTQTIDAIDTRDLCRYTVYACRNLGKSGEVYDLGSGTAISCNKGCEVILDVMDEMGYCSASELKHIPMRLGEKPGVNLVADMTKWEALDMYPEYTFEETVRATVEYMETLSGSHLKNALRFYGKCQD